MIGYIEGEIISLIDDNIIVKTGGVGYRIFVGNNSFTLGQSVKLFIYTNVNEREISLIGFETEKELKLFNLLLNVNGVGPKTAHKFINALGVDNIVNYISNSDDKSLRVAGVGAKTASKIIIDLKNKIEKYFSLTQGNSNRNQFSPLVVSEASSALENLGYTSKEIKAALNDIEYDDSINNAQSLLKFLLKHLR